MDESTEKSVRELEDRTSPSPTVLDLAATTLEQELLFAAGVSDRRNGVSRYDGWKALCRDIGYSHGSTPARNRYEDGWYVGGEK
jgi:hypothetical protein